MKRKHKPESDHSPQAGSKHCDEVKVQGSIQVFESQNAIEQHDAERRDDKTYKVATGKYEKAIWFWTRLAAIVSALYFGATGFILWQSIRSANSAKSAADTATKTLEISQKQFRGEQRPYIWADAQSAFDEKNPKAILFRHPDGSVTVSWRIFLRNSGRSPAIDVLATPSETFVSLAQDFEKTTVSYTPPVKESGSFLAPESQSVIETGELKTFSQKEFLDVQSGKKIVFVLGVIQYRDIFEPQIARYETRYCFMYNPAGMPIATCPDGNTVK